MRVTSAQLAELIAELHEVNEELAEAARPLDRLPDLDPTTVMFWVTRFARPCAGRA